MKPDEIMPEVPLNIGENRLKKPQRMNDRHLAYCLLRKQGMAIEQASKALGLHPRSGYKIEKRVSQYDLTSEFWLSKASRALKNIIEGKPFNEVTDIKGSTVVEAVKMVFDRHQPVIRRQENLNINADLGFVDLSKYRIRYPEEDTSQKASSEGI